MTFFFFYGQYDFYLICRLWESVKGKKKMKTNNDVVTLPLTLMSQFVKILKQKTLAENLQTKDLDRPSSLNLVPSMDVITWMVNHVCSFKVQSCNSVFGNYKLVTNRQRRNQKYQGRLRSKSCKTSTSNIGPHLSLFFFNSLICLEQLITIFEFDPLFL